ncbi:MAG: flagellar motor switch protein FliN [Bryobacteraceae bacterium]|nr:flagellar motor switch protein FliN [Bryobacteraceae bacterium]
MPNLRPVIEAWPKQLAQTLEMMTGAPVQVSSTRTANSAADLWWENTFSTEPRLQLFAGASNEDWMSAASVILEAAGIDQIDEAEARSTWLEILEQTASSTARQISAGLPGPIETTSGKQADAPAPGGETHEVTVVMGDRKISLVLTVVRLEAAVSPSKPSNQPPRTLAVPEALPPEAQVQQYLAPSRTMDALLDVHLPVSISFGQSKIPLRDVLKLTTGSVVELNRQPEDSVDIIVNDCVIARGEVVVVDGNYAVRIQSIVGRQQRLSLRPDRQEAGGKTR